MVCKSAVSAGGPSGRTSSSIMPASSRTACTGAISSCWRSASQAAAARSCSPPAVGSTGAGAVMGGPSLDERFDLPQPPRQVLDRLGFVVVAAGFERLLAVAGHRLGRERNHGDVGRGRVGANPPRGFQTVEVGQPDVHEYDLWRLAL